MSTDKNEPIVVGENRLLRRELEKANERAGIYCAALEEISKGEGAFNRDPLQHAENTIDNMKSVATKALLKAFHAEAASLPPVVGPRQD